MKKSKKRSSNRRVTNAEFAERTGVLQSLRDQFPDVIAEMIKLLTTTNKDCENHLHQFAFELSGIIHLYGRRLKSPRVKYAHPGIATHPDYIANQHARREKLENAVQALMGLTTDLHELDACHIQQFISSYKTPTGRTNYNASSELFAEIEIATRIIAACQEAHSSTFKAPVKKRSRPPVPYVDAARELMDIWEKYTGEEVPVSKTHQHKVMTNPARFIWLGISLLDPTATDANAVTAINNARSQTS